MKKLLPISIFIFSAIAGYCSDRKISSVESSGNWIYVYDDQGKRYQTLSKSSAGDVCGFSSTFFVTVNGNWIYLYNADGKRYKTLSKSSVGEVVSVGGDTFTTRHGNWIYTWNSEGKKINTRYAH